MTFAGKLGLVIVNNKKVSNRVDIPWLFLSDMQETLSLDIVYPQVQLHSNDPIVFRQICSQYMC